MKKSFITLLFLLLLNNIFAQNTRNLTIVSAEDLNFTAYINQQQVNNIPMKMVKLTGLTNNYYSVTIYVGNSTNSIQANLYVPPSSEVVYEFFVNNNQYSRGKFFVKDLFPINTNQPNTGGNTFPWGNNNSNGSNNNQQGAINININNNSNSNSGANSNAGGVGGNQPIYVPGYVGEIGCTPPLTADRFNSMLHTIKKQSFSDSKLRVAKQIIRNNCITVNNLIRILELFDFEDSKLKLAKFSYDYVYDIENYYKVNNVFDFDSSVKNLDNYIQNR